MKHLYSLMMQRDENYNSLSLFSKVGLNLHLILKYYVSCKKWQHFCGLAFVDEMIWPSFYDEDEKWNPTISFLVVTRNPALSVCMLVRRSVHQSLCCT